MSLMPRQIGLSATPVLSTGRLILRAPEAGDLAGFTAFKASPRARFTGGQCGPEEAFQTFAMVTGHWALLGHGLFTITSRKDGTALGLAGTLSPPGWPEPEIAWNLWSEASEGQGIAFEAASAVRDHAFGALGWQTAVSLIARDNPRSQALAERLGAVAGEDCEVFGQKTVIWRHPRPVPDQQGAK